MKTPAIAQHAHRAIPHPRAPRLDCVVTADMITDAKVRDSSHCMTSAAIEAVRPDAFKIAVDLQTIRWSDRDKRLRYIYLTPRNVQKAIVLWDQGQKVEPFSFRLTGAHVTTMYEAKPKVQVITPDGKLTAEGRKAATNTAYEKGRVKANLAREGLRLESSGKVPTRVGGKAPPLDVPFSRRRAFGLRALVR